MLTIFLHHIHFYDGAGYMVVSFFFILSGFSLTMGYSKRINNNQFSFFQYIIRRFARLYPIHWLCLIAVLPLVLLNIYLGSLKVGEVLPIFLNASLLQSMVPVKDFYFSFNWVSWYLSDIIIMAILFPFIYRLIKRVPFLMNLAILVAMVIAYTLLIRVLPVDWHHAILYINPFIRLIDFIIGINAALLFFHWDVYRTFKETVDIKKSVFIAVAIISFLTMIIISTMVNIDNPYSIALFYWVPVCILIFSVSAVNRLGGGIFTK